MFACVCVAELDNDFTLLLAIALIQMHLLYYAMVRYTKLSKAKQVKLKVKGAREAVERKATSAFSGLQAQSFFLSEHNNGWIINHYVTNTENCRSM